MTAPAGIPCPSCGRANAAGSFFCSGCATPLSCPGCQAPLPADAQFCAQCGRQVGRRLDASRLDASIGRPVERRVESTPHLRIFVQTGSFADQQSAAIGQRLETLIATLGELLGLPEPPGPISIYLGEVLNDPAQPGKALTAGSYAVPERREVWSIFRSDAPGVDIERTMARLLLQLQTGRDPGQAPLLLDGLVSVVGQRLGFVPPPEALAQMLAGMVASGAPIALRPLLGGPTPETQQFYPLVSVAFVGYLISDRGAPAFLKLLGSYDPQNPDAAARAAYNATFEALEKRWLQAVKKAGPRTSGIGRFLKVSWTLTKPYRLKQAEILIYVLFSIAFTQALPFAQRYLFDNAFPHVLPNGTFVGGDKGTLFSLLGIGLLVFFALAGASLRQQYLNAQVSEGVMRSLRTRMFSRLQSLSADYYSRTSTGDILSRMSNDLFAVDFALTGALLQGFILVMTFIISLASLLYLNWKLTLMALVVLPLFFLTTKFLGPPAAKASRERQDQFGAVTGVLQENVAAQPVIRAYGLQNTFIREYMASVQRLYQTAIRVVFLGSLFGLSATLLTTLIQVLVLGIGGYFVIQGQLTLGSLVAFLGLISGLIAPAQSMSGVAQALQQATGAMDRVNEVLNTEPKIADKPGAVPAEPLKEGITFENVTFSYTGAEPQLVDMSFTIPAGTSVAFVGPSGSGKSTVTNLVSRFYDADRGRVLYDGRDVRDLQVDSLRRQIGLVSQDNFLFNRSVRENIRFGREGATDEEVEAAARAAEVHDFIMAMPMGYDTPVGERGGNLSGGQRQRIAIARAILRNPSILILDEATSALDPRTENAINHTLASLAKGRTTISVTHRLAAAATADRIFVLDRGRLAEQGSHNELLAQGGLYARLYEEQSGAVPGGVLKLALEIEYLRRVPIFATLNGDQLSSLASRLTTERAEDGADVIKAGETGDKLYLILSGEASVIGRDAAGHERELTVLRAGDYFGEIALLYDTPRTATVRARSALTLYSLDREGFLSLLESVPGLRQTIEQAIAERHVSRGAERPAAAELSPAAASPAVAVAQPEQAIAAPGEQPAASLFVAPWTRQRSRLLLQDEAGNRRAITLNEQFTGIGRNPNNDIVLPDRRVSGFHARIERDASGRFILTDSGSTNGTRVNGQPITSVELRDGDVIQLGGTTLQYEQGA